MLREDVIESELIYNGRLALMTAFAALHAHPDADIEKGGQAANVMFMDAEASIPYLTQGMTGTELLHKERSAAIDRYNALRDSVLKKKE